jgi:hypothetical protein
VCTLSAMLSRSVARVVVAGLVVLATGCSGFEKVPEGDVDASQKAVAQRIGTKLWEGCRTGQHEPLAEDEAIPQMREGLTPQKMAGACASAKGQFGDFVSMDYAETYKPKMGSMRIYRFKGNFSNASTPPEIRVVMDGSKLSGFWIKPWSDTLH